jgi:hypothetical protein
LEKVGFLHFFAIFGCFVVTGSCDDLYVVGVLWSSHLQGAGKLCAPCQTGHKICFNMGKTQLFSKNFQKNPIKVLSELYI